MQKPRAILLNEDEDRLNVVFGQGRRQHLAEITQLHETCLCRATLDRHADVLKETEVIFSTWGMPALSAEEVAYFPSLKAVFYAAGTVKSFATPFLERGVTVCSAWGANAVSVAEFCLAQILLSLKGYFRNTRDCQTPPEQRTLSPFRGKGAYGETVALIGAGQIGRRLIQLLAPFNLQILVVDPYLSGKEAEELHVRKVSLEEAFQEALVVSNHLPNLPTLQRVLTGTLFASMRPNACFINTGRGAQVNETELVDVLRKRPDLLALLDVTYPEPAPLTSGFYDLPNVQLSSHLAGAHDDEVLRMADFMLEEFTRWVHGQPLKYAISAGMLERMA